MVRHIKTVRCSGQDLDSRHGPAPGWTSLSHLLFFRHLLYQAEEEEVGFRKGRSYLNNI